MSFVTKITKEVISMILHFRKKERLIQSKNSILMKVFDAVSQSKMFD